MKQPQKLSKNKISLKFMDIAVSIEGSTATKKNALSLISALLQNRMKVFEILDTLEDSHDDNELSTIPKDKRVKFDSMFQ